jgi:hypothetical protein
MIAAPLAPGREGALRALLASMTITPGWADPHNALLPFGAFEQLHYARLVLLDDALQADLKVYGVQPPRLDTLLALIGDCDGPAGDCLAAMVERAGEGLRRIFGHCQGFDPGADLLQWLRAHDCPSAASYVHWVGRTVRQIREERALQAALSKRVPRPAPSAAADETPAQRTRDELRAFVAAEQAAGRLALTPPQPTPEAWQLAQWVHLLALPLAALVVLPLLLLLSPLIVWRLRTLEDGDPEICPRPVPADLQALEALEDFDVSNQYTAIGAVKPGRFRRWLVSVLLVLIDYTCRHIFTHGFLARVQTIHFARWVFIDDKARVVFASNYDGSHQGYMDDFINKVGWGLNLVFSNGVGWPRTRWLILGGARLENRFKRYQRRHQLPTQVWYKAYPGLTLADLHRNQRIREGLEQPRMSDAQAQAWLGLL